MNEKIIDFKKYKEKRDEEKVLWKRAEQKEKAMVSVKIDLGKISEIDFYRINDFLGENYIIGQLEKEGGLFFLSIPEISEADFHKVVSFLKDINVDVKIEEYKEK